MPNHVKNIVHMKGITTLPFFIPDKYENGGGIDFNKVIPMPESLNIESGSIELVAIDAINRKLNERMYHYHPKNSYPLLSNAEFAKKLKVFKKTEKEMLELGLQYITNLVRYDATTWYDWCCDNWGTKWNAYCDEVIDEDTVSFETAWCSPIPVIRKMSELYPKLGIEHWWADEDMGINDGHIIYHDGKVTEELVEDLSNTAYEIYVKCWGPCECLYTDNDGIMHRYNCDTCDRCEQRRI